MKNLKKVLFSLALVLGLMFFSVNGVHAKGKGGGTVLVPDPNPDGVDGCSLVDPETPTYPGDEEENDDENKENDPKKDKEQKNNNN